MTSSEDEGVARLGTFKMVADAVDKQCVAQGNIEAQNGIASFDTCAQVPVASVWVTHDF